jgi:ATP-dependent RNA helicase MSS116
VQAYISNLGFIKSLMKLYRVDAPTVVKLGNQFAKSIGLDDPPPLGQSLVSKMGLKGVPGLVIEGKGLVVGSAPAAPPAQGRRPPPRNPAGAAPKKVHHHAAGGGERSQGKPGLGPRQARGFSTRRGKPTGAGKATAGTSTEGNGGQSSEPRPKRPRW